MQYEWDSLKRQTNREKHHVDFTEIESFEWDSAVVQREERRSEVRYRAIGYIGDRLHVVIYTLRGGTFRIISLWRAGRKDRRLYAKS